MIVKQINESNKPEGLGQESDGILLGFEHGDALVCQNNLEWHNSWESLGKWIASNLKPTTVLDLGSGGGSLSWWVRKYSPNTTYVSVDINKEAAESPFYKGENSHHFIAYTDQPLHFVNEKNETIKFQLIVSIEHFEHIRPETFDVFLENIKRHMEYESSMVLASASIISRATPSCMDTCHVNIKTRDEWCKYLTDRGFEMLGLTIIGGERQPKYIMMGLQTNELIFKLHYNNKQ